MNSARSSGAHLAFLLLLLACAGALLYRSPRSASDLRRVPDAVEYAVGAQRFATLGTYDIDVAGRRLPARYPPAFSVLFLAPAYALLGPDLGYATFPLLAFGLAGIVAAWWLGRRLAGPWGGLAAGAAVLLHPLYLRWGREVMVDVPFTALVLWGTVAVVEIRRRADASVWWFVFGGLCLALAGSMRATGFAFLIPLVEAALRRPIVGQRWIASAGALAAPCAAVSANAAYNVHVFGSPLRNGYQFWCSVPLDYFDLSFSLSFVPGNASRLFLRGSLLALIVCVIAVLFLSRRFPGNETSDAERSSASSVIGMALFGGVPLLLFHLLYFYPDARFALPVAALLAVLIAALVVRWMRGRWIVAIVPVLLLGFAVDAKERIRKRDTGPSRRSRAEAFARTQNDAIIITAIDAVYLEPLVVRGTGRSIVPLWRGVEYASKVIVRKRIDPAAVDLLHSPAERTASLLAGGAEQAVAFVAAENLERVRAWVEAGRPVYLDGSFVNAGGEPEFRRIYDAFEKDEAAPELWRLRAASNR